MAVLKRLKVIDMLSVRTIETKECDIAIIATGDHVNGICNQPIKKAISSNYIQEKKLYNICD